VLIRVRWRTALQDGLQQHFERNIGLTDASPAKAALVDAGRVSITKGEST
jgi:hypothetical protein